MRPNVGQTEIMREQDEMLQREVMNRDPDFSLKILRIRHGMIILFLVVGIALLLALCVQALIGRGPPMSPSTRLYAGTFLLLWNGIVIALLRQNSAAINSVKSESESMKRLK